MANEAPTYDETKIKHFETMFRNALDYAANAKLPITVVEGACRDALSNVDAHRSLSALRARGAKI